MEASEPRDQCCSCSPELHFKTRAIRHASATQHLRYLYIHSCFAHSHHSISRFQSTCNNEISDSDTSTLMMIWPSNTVAFTVIQAGSCTVHILFNVYIHVHIALLQTRQGLFNRQSTTPQHFEMVVHGLDVNSIHYRTVPLKLTQFLNFLIRQQKKIP